MVSFGQYVLDGLGVGAIYALAALGLVLIFKTTDVVNFASGAMGTVVTFILWAVFGAAGLPLLVGWLCAMAGALVVGALTEFLFLRRIKGAPVLIQIVLTLGLLLAIEGLSGMVWGYDPKTLPKVVDRPSPLAVGPYTIQPNDLFIIAVTIVLSIVFYILFERTRIGLAMRSVAQDREVAALMGIRVERYVTASWALGVLVVGVAAILYTPNGPGLSPTMMDDIAVYPFAAAVLGGFGSLAGAIVGGFVIGVVGNVVTAWDPQYELPIVFLLIVAVLYIRPQGLFGVEAQTRQ